MDETTEAISINNSSNSNSAKFVLASVSSTVTGVDYSTILIGILAQAMFSVPGIVPNAMLVFITWKHKSLQTIYGCFLAQTVFWDLVTEFAFALPLVNLLLSNQIGLLLCICLQFYDSFGLFLAELFALVISLERLLAICAPIRHWHMTAGWQKWTIVNVISCSLMLLSYLHIHTFLLFAIENSQRHVYCVTADYIQGPFAVAIYYISVTLSSVIFAVYVLIWILMKVGLKYHHQMNQRIFKSLATITSIIFICYTGSYALRSFLSMFTMDPNTKTLMNKLLGNLTRLSGAINAPVLFVCSSQYREIMCNEFKWLCRFNKQQICPMQTIVLLQKPTDQQHRGMHPAVNE